MDQHSLEKLEFHRVQALLATYCRSSLGRGLAAQISPARKRPMIRRWLQQTCEMQALVDEVGLPPMAGVHDIRDLVDRAVPPTRLTPKDFATMGETLAATRELRRWIDQAETEMPTLVSVTERIVDFGFIADQINRAVDAQGAMRDDASERLGRIRRAISEASDQIGVVIGRLLRSTHVTKMLQFPNATFHNDRIVLPLKSEHHGRLEGIIHRSSDTGATLFVEPAEVVELNNAIAKLRRDEHEEIGRILFKLTRAVHANAGAIGRAIGAIATLDLIVAKVLMAREHEMVVPELSDEGVLQLRSARHPVLLAMQREEVEAGLEPREVVPIDVRLGDDFDLLIITGPNTGGKTVALKTTGLLTFMVHAGLPIPAGPGSCVPVLDDILIDVGDEQSLEQSLSTFSAHLSRILHVLGRATRHTLVLLDELGAGTDPDEGAAIGRAIVDRLLGLRCLGMLTTHLGALKSIGLNHDRADNAAVEFDVETLRPTYRLVIGQPGQSNAIAVAAQLGMPAEMVEAAKGYLPEQHRALSEAIAGTLDSRRKAEQARAEAEDAKVAAADAQADALARAEELNKLKSDFETWAQRVTHLRAGDAVHVISFDCKGRVVRIKLAQQRAEVDLGEKTVDIPLSDLHPDDAPAPPPKPPRPESEVVAPAKNAEKATPPAKGKKAPAKGSSGRQHKTGGNGHKKKEPLIEAPPMSPEQILALKPGDHVFVRRFQKVGDVVRLKPEKSKVVVSLGMMDAEVDFEEVCTCPSGAKRGGNGSKEGASRGATGSSKKKRASRKDDANRTAETSAKRS